MPADKWLGMVGVVDNVVKINPKYSETPTWAVKASLKCNKDRDRHALGFQVLKLKMREHQQAPLCINLKDGAYKMHHKRRKKKNQTKQNNKT